ncbi:hypothetical protein KI387_035783 [Taxus chinensis]|uniref:U-box domain-containing protein n=1 Tax=Taxus chinensis TaxID=29808 RepID=A0AA38FPF2_TAXCH|nr:hypothetical protein KI387_035783 [Taxus chinensis]
MKREMDNGALQPQQPPSAEKVSVLVDAPEGASLRWLGGGWELSCCLETILLKQSVEGTDSGCKVLCEDALTVHVLVKIILKVSGRATEYAAGALLVTCSASETSQKGAIQAGILTQLLLLVHSDCMERAKRKAQMLLKLLRNAWPDDSSSPGFGRTDVVPVQDGVGFVVEQYSPCFSIVPKLWKHIF